MRLTQPFPTTTAQYCIAPKTFWGANILSSSEQQYFGWDTASQNTKRQDMLDIWVEHGLLSPTLGYVHATVYAFLA